MKISQNQEFESNWIPTKMLRQKPRRDEGKKPKKDSVKDQMRERFKSKRGEEQ